MWKAVVRAALRSIFAVITLAGCPSDDESAPEEAADADVDGSVPSGNDTDASGEAGQARDSGNARADAAMAIGDSGPGRPELGTLCTTTTSGTTCLTNDVLMKTDARVKAVRTSVGGYQGFEVTVTIPNYSGSSVRITSLKLAGSVLATATLPSPAPYAEVLNLLLPEKKCEHEPWLMYDPCLSTDTVDGTFTQSVCEGRAVETLDEPSDITLTVHELTDGEVWATFSGNLAVENCFPKKVYQSFCDFDPNAPLLEQVCGTNGRCHQEERQPAHCIDETVPFEVVLRLPIRVPGP